VVALSENEAFNLAMLDRLQRANSGAVSARTCSHRRRVVTLSLSLQDDDVVIEWLYASYQSGDDDLQRYVLSFAPLLLWLYHTRAKVPGVVAMLLLIYNHVVELRGGKPVYFNAAPVESIYSRRNTTVSWLHLD
jgi:hypothetical protein